MLSSTCIFFLGFVLVGLSWGQHNVITRQVGGTSTPILFSMGDPRVQVFRDGKWGYICAHHWDSKDAEVICRMQHFWHGKGTARIIPASGVDKIWLDNVECIGNETDISQCRFQGWGITSCPEAAVAGVDCETSVTSNVRLTSGFGAWEGRVEVYENNVWRPVCTRGWDDKDAQVICRQLKIRSDGGTAHTDGKYGSSGANPIVTNTNCKGTETDISRCPATRTTAGCTNAGVECYNCGQKYTLPSGVLMSDNFPQPYPRNMHCKYLIRPSDSNQLYKLEFSNFQTESCCDHVHVKVLNSTDTGAENRGTMYSGDNKPPMLLGKAFLVSFDSDGSQDLQGFKAVWSPALVEDVVKMTCDSGMLTIKIDLLFLRRLYPQSSERTIALADPACTGKIVNDYIVINTNADSCGTILKTVGDHHVYSNFLVDRIFAAESLMIVRDERWKIPVTCTVQRSDEYTVHYDPYTNVGRRRAKAAEVIERMRREVKGHIKIDQQFPIYISIYQDRGLTVKVFNNQQWRMASDLFFKVHLDNADTDLKLVVSSCYVIPSYSATTSQQYYLTRNGCSADSNTVILRTTSHYTDIQMKVFKFAGNYDHVYITCDVKVCPTNDNSTSCVQSCHTGAGRRSISTNQKDMQITSEPIFVID